MKTSQFKYILLLVTILLTTSALAIDTADIQLNLFPNNVSSNTEHYGGVLGGGNNTEWYMDFDGTDDYASTNFQPSSATFSTSIWFKADSTTGDKILTSTRVGGTAYGSEIAIADNKLRFNIYDGTTNAYKDIAFTDTSSWHLATLTYDGNNVHTYLDGVYGGQSGTLTGFTGHNSLNIGGRGPSVFFNGQIKNVLWFDKELTQTEINNSYNAGKNAIIDTTDANLVYYISMDGLTDLSSNGNNANAYEGITILNDNIYSFDGVNQYVKTPDFLDTTSDFSISFWVDPDSLVDGDRIFEMKANVNCRAGTSNTIYCRLYDGTNYDVTSSTISLTSFSHIVLTRSKTTGMELYVNDVSVDTNAYTGNPTDGAGFSNIGGRPGSTFYEGLLTSILVFNKTLNSTEVTEIYNNGRTYEYFPKIPPVPPTPTYEYPYEQINTVYSTTNVTVLSDTYVTVLSGSAPSTTAIPLYITATFNSEKTFGNLASDLTCYMELNGVRISRDVWINDSVTNHHKANYIMSDRVNTTTTGNSTLDFLCRRTGNGQFNVNNIVVAGFRQIDSVDYNFSQVNLDLNFSINSPSANVTINSVLFPVPQWNLSNSNKSIYALYDSELLISSGTTNELSGYLTIDNLTCPTMHREITTGQTGSGNLICAANVTGQNNTNISSYGQGIFDVDTKINIKYLAFEDYEFKQSFLSNEVLNNSEWTDLVSNTIFIDDSDKDIFAMASISAESTTGEIHTEYRFKIASENGSFILREFDASNSPGLVTNQFVFKELSSQNYTVTLQSRTEATTPGDEGQVINAVVWSYAAGQSTATANTFGITAQDTIFSTALQTFTASDGVSLSTTTGTINYPKQEGLINLTLTADNYFNTTVLNHNTSNNLQFDAVPYIWLNLTASSLVDASAISNFTVDCNSYGESTADGAYLMYQLQEPLNNTDVLCSFTHPDYANTDFNVTSVNTSSIRAYTIEAYTTNSVNFSFVDATTGNAITDLLNVFLFNELNELFNYDFNTTTGSYYVDLISPSDYRGVIESTTYDEATFEITVSNKSYQTKIIYLYPNATAEQITYTVIDDLGNVLEDAKVLALRYDEDSSTWSSVAECYTNAQGVCYINLEPNKYYKYQIYYSDDQTPDLLVDFEILSYTTRSPFILSLTGSVGGDFAIYDDVTITNFDYTKISSGNATREYLFELEASFNDGLVDSVCMEVYYRNNIMAPQIVSTQCMTSTGDLVYQDELLNKTYYAEAYVVVNGNRIDLERLRVPYNSTKSIFGTFGLVIVLFAVMGGIMFGYPDPVKSSMGGLLGFFIGSVFGFAPIGFSALLTFVIVILIALYRKRGAGSV